MNTYKCSWTLSFISLLSMECNLYKPYVCLCLLYFLNVFSLIYAHFFPLLCFKGCLEDENLATPRSWKNHSRKPVCSQNPGKKTFLHMCIICWLFKFVKQKGERNTNLRNLWLYWWILINNLALINILNITLNNEHRLNKVRAIMNQFYTVLLWNLL